MLYTASEQIVHPIMRVRLWHKTSLLCGLSQNISWYYENRHPHPMSPPISHQNHLIISKTLLNHTGVYYCVGLLIGGEKQWSMSQTELRVYGQ